MTDAEIIGHALEAWRTAPTHRDAGRSKAIAAIECALRLAIPADCVVVNKWVLGQLLWTQSSTEATKAHKALAAIVNAKKP